MTTFRKLDGLGRIVIPKDIRNKLQLEPGDEVEIAYTKNQLIVSLCKDQICEWCGSHCDYKFLYCPHCGEKL